MCCPLWDTPSDPLNPPAWGPGDLGGFLMIFGVLEVPCGFCRDGVPTAAGVRLRFGSGVLLHLCDLEFPP